MNIWQLRWGISYSALLWALAVAAPQPAGAASKVTVLHNFTGGTDGAYPIGRPTKNGKGGFYGLTPEGGYPGACGKKGCGVVYELTPPKAGGRAWAETVIYRFKGGSDGAAPLAALLRDRTGALYGTTSEGGGGDCHSYQSFISGFMSTRFYWVKEAKIGCGTVFKLTPPANGGSIWTESVLYRFSGKEGRAPSGTLLIDKTGALYGAAEEGGPGQCGYFSSTAPYSGSRTSALQYRTGCGAVFKLTPPARGHTVWTETGLYLFKGKADGAFPAQRLTVSDDGSFYGVTTGGDGTVYALAPPAATHGSWTLSTIFSFTDGVGGSSPVSGLIQDANGNLFGAAGDGPDGNWGTVYKLSPPVAGQGAWTATDLQDFIDQFSGRHSTFGNGLTPTGLTANDATGGFFGTTSSGGDPKCGKGNGCGVVFALIPPRPGKPHWTETVLGRFDGTDGDNPRSSVAVGTAGDLFGTTEDGGFHRLGTVFEVTR